MDTWRTARRRPAILLGLLLATLVLATVLALQAVMAAQYHRTAAESVLRDYARAAAEEYARRVSQEFEYYGHYPIFRVLDRLKAGDPSVPLPDPVELGDGMGDQEDALELVRYFFRMDLAEGTVAASGAAPAAGVLGWLRDTLQIHARDVFEPKWRSAILVQSGTPTRMFAYTVERGDERPLAALGFEIDLTIARNLFEQSAARAPLLPLSLMRGIHPDSAMSVQLVTASQDVIHRYGANGFATSPFTARVTGGPQFGDLGVRVSLDPEVAQHLIIGGVPRSRLPLIGGLLLLTAALIGLALLQLRREQEFQRQRAEFVDNVSHELRTPLAQIRMFAETLLLGRVRSEAERRRSLEILDQEARRLTHLVENVLLFSRAERQDHSVSPEPTELASLAREVLERFGPLAAASGVRIDAQLAEPVDSIVDRAAVQQILLNLLDNAVKYGPQGQTVMLRLSKNRNRVRFEVEDRGPGIPEEAHARIWERFHRLERERTSAVAGTGIGLSVVRHLVDLHGGRAWMEARSGGGSRFVVELPLTGPAHSNGGAMAAVDTSGAVP